MTGASTPDSTGHAGIPIPKGLPECSSCCGSNRPDLAHRRGSRRSGEANTCRVCFPRRPDHVDEPVDAAPRWRSDRKAGRGLPRPALPCPLPRLPRPADGHAQTCPPAPWMLRMRSPGLATCAVPNASQESSRHCAPGTLVRYNKPGVSVLLSGGRRKNVDDLARGGLHDADRDR